MRKAAIRWAVAATIGASGSALAGAGSFADPVTTGYAEVDGLRMYYEVHGDGAPVVVLHGAYMTTGLMRPVTDGLAATRQVIAVDLQGHGRTADVDRPITYERMADDVAAAMAAIGVPRADVFGYSMGAGVAYQLAIRHPDRVRRLAAASAAYRADGVYPELVEMIGEMTPESFAGSPWEAAYKDVAPNPEDFHRLVEKLMALDTVPHDWPADAMRSIDAPTLVISGDADIVRPEHSVEIFRLRGGGPSADFMTAPTSELAILPGTTHLGILERTDLLVPMVATFFDRTMKGEDP